MEYQVGDTVPLYATFVQQTGEAATISGVPTVTVFHRAGINTVIDLNHGSMSLLSGITYFYLHVIPAKADMTNYEVRYDAIFSGTSLTNVVGGEGFRTVPHKFFEGKAGGMVKEVRVTKKDTWKEDEKNTVLDLLGRLAGELKSDAIENKLEKIERLINNPEKGQDAGYIPALVDLKEGNQISRNKIDALISELHSLGSFVKDIPAYDDAKIIDALNVMKVRLTEIDSKLHTEKLSWIISNMEDLRMELEELKKVLVASLPVDILERIKNDKTG